MPKTDKRYPPGTTIEVFDGVRSVSYHVIGSRGGRVKVHIPPKTQLADPPSDKVESKRS